jgi:hypothetical protein
LDRPVSDHIERIKQRLAEFAKEREQTTDPLKISQIEMDIRSLKLALAHYELAMELEEEVFQARTTRIA